MSDFLQFLRDEAITLGEDLLPSPEELRTVVGALAQRLARAEEEVFGELKAPPEPDPASQIDPAFANQAQPGPVVTPTVDVQAAAAPQDASSVATNQAGDPVVHDGALEDAEAQLEAAQARVDALRDLKQARADSTEAAQPAGAPDSAPAPDAGHQTP